MKYLFSIIPFLFLMTARTCDQKVAEDQGPVFKLGETLNLAYQKQTTIKSEGLTLSYQNLQESRCPDGTQCMRAGEAKIELLIEKEGKSESALLEAKGLCMDTSGKCGSSQQLMGYNIQLLSADPYPKGGTQKPLSSTSVRVIVTSL